MSENNQILKKKTDKHICCVPQCSNRFDKCNIPFHRFPKPGKRSVYITNFFGNKEKIDQFEAWKKALKVTVLSSSSKVCSLHFTKDDYIYPDHEDIYRRLKTTAVPSCNLPGKSQEELNLMKKREQRVLNRNLKKVDSPAPVYDIQEVLPSVSFNDQIDSSDQLISPPPPNVTKCDVGVQVETDFLKPRFTAFITNDSELSTLTGIESFKILTTIIDIVTTAFGNRLDHHNIKMNIHDRIIMTYVKLKQNLSYSCMAVLFQCYRANQCRQVFYDMIQILSACLKVVIHWPSRETISRNLPKCFEGFEDTRVVVDCTEIFTQHPKNLCCQLITHSSYKKSQTVKFLTGVTPAGNISYISRAYGGRASDKAIFEKSDLTTLLEKGDAVMVDKGFIIDEICAKNNWKCYRPPFLREKKQFSKEDSLLTCKIAKARVHVERSNQRIKSFKIVGDRISSRLIPHIEDIFTVICATVNLSSPIIKDDKFMEN